MAKRKTAQGTKKQAQPGKQPSGGGTKPPRPAPLPKLGPAPLENGGDADPPIIISGGSVTIKSAVFLTSSYDPVEKKYIYRSDVKIGKIHTKGKKDQTDDSNNGAFTIKLFKSK